MTHLSLPLSGLHCRGCTQKLEQKLNECFSVNIRHLSISHIDLETDAELTDVIAAIESLNYHVIPQYYQLTGLHCDHCVKKLRTALEETNKVAEIDITTADMSLVTGLTDSEVQQLTDSLGFSATKAPSPQPNEATPSSSQKNNDSHSDNESSMEIKPSPSLPHTTEDQEMTFLLIKGMTCASCVASVEKALNSNSDVQRAQVNLAEQSAIVYSEQPIADMNALLNTVAAAGYQAEIVASPEHQQKEQQKQLHNVVHEHRRNAVAGLLIGFPIMCWGLLGGSMKIDSAMSQVAWGCVGMICFVLLVTAGRNFYLNAGKALMHKRATMDTLIALGTGAAWVYSIAVVLLPNAFPDAARHVYFEATAMIIGLISLGHAIEANAKAKTSLSLQSLIKLQPQKAIVVDENSHEKEMDISLIQRGMNLSIKPGDQIPVDGKVVSGESYIDESMLTGEPIPALKRSGSCVSAGTFNQDGHLIIQATSIGANTMLARIINMVRSAQSSKPQIAKLADSIAAVFVPVVIAIAIMSAGIWYVFGPEPQINYMLIIATTVLVIACPCALGLATPLSVTAGIGKAAEMGILIRDAESLQNMSRVTTVVFDKTGTLTQGTPKVKHFYTHDADPTELLSIANAIEKKSEHPLGKAICQYAANQSISPVHIEHFTNVRGQGISATWSNQKVLIGSLSYLNAQGIDISSATLNSPSDSRSTITSVGIAINHQFRGIFLIADELKPQSKQVVEHLNAMGIETVMLTGDTRSAAKGIALSLGIQNVIAGVLPDQKAEKIQQLQTHGAIVAMIGDGINDAPALAQADVGIAMGNGSDIAIETAHMTVLNASPLSVIHAIELSQATLRNIKQNLFGAFIYNSLGIPIAAGVLYPFTGFLLNPVIAGSAMALSSITVVTNANRLRQFKLSQ